MSAYGPPTDSIRTGTGPRLTLLIDTCILIDYLRGHEPAKCWFSDVVGRYDVQVTCSVVTLAELLAGLKGEGKGREVIASLWSLLVAVRVDEAIAAIAGDYMRQWRPSHGLTMPDALIAATARQTGASLVTRDVAHFPMGDIKVIMPY